MGYFEQLAEIKYQEGYREGYLEGYREGYLEGYQTGLQLGREMAIRSLLSNSELSRKKIAQIARIPLSQVRKLKGAL